MKVKIQKNYTTEKHKIRLKIKTHIINTFKIIGCSLHGLTECIGVICMVFFFLGTDPDTKEYVFIQVWNENIQKNGIFYTLLYIAMFFIIGYIYEKALKDL